jgi:PST family polysaccharide transporter
MSPKESFSSSILQGLKWMYLSSGVTALSRFFVIIFMTRLLTPEDFGLMGIALIFTSLAERVGQIGVGPALIQRQELSESELRAGAVLSVACGLIIFLALYLSAPAIAVFFEAPSVVWVVRVLALVFVADGLSMVSDCLLNRRLAFKQIMIAENVGYIIGNVLLGIVLALAGFGVWALALSMLTSRVVRAVILVRCAPHPLMNFHFRLSEAASLLKQGLGFSLSRIFSFMALQGDNFVVGRTLGVDALGMYTRGYQLMTLPATYLGQVLERVLFPAMSQKQGSVDKLKAVYCASLELVCLTALPMSVAIGLLAPEIVGGIFGEKWIALTPVLELLAFGVFFRTAYKCSDTLVRSKGAAYELAIRQLLYTIFIVVGAYVGATLGGLEGGARAVVIAVFANYVIMSRLGAQVVDLSFSEFARAHLSGAWVSLACGIGLWAATILTRGAFHPLVALAIDGCIGGAVAAAAFFLAPADLRPFWIGLALGKDRLVRFGRPGRIVGRALGCPL